MPADIIEFPSAWTPHGLRQADIAELHHCARVMPGVVVTSSYDGDCSRLWLCFPRAVPAPAFGFARRDGLVYIAARGLAPGCPDCERQTPFASITAAVAELMAALNEIRPAWWTSGPPAA